ncbi:InlB B-repeat-containing protein [Terrisporobacter mayombei]|uniref:InlB B-repeat-containing protein n=1 Tax=Terrisporobacter othiniensis TaxID=1577792 RepID=UPI0024189313|nr:InlB B-repeat-containing protein [Terrisporobacter othiniensis]MCC3669324.1 InlB B-repeat-containing protein [Terrisporobacter mayombei]MDU6983648.1 InlB B-repeat-containing protein [Terrisporobacter othiniensis]
MYKLTLNSNSGKLPATSSTKKFTTGKLVGTLPNPTRQGYYFKGWYTSKTGGSKITSSTRYYYMSNKTLYVRWEKVSVSKASISKLTLPDSKQIKVYTKSVSNAKGYEIVYSTSSKFSSSTTKKISTISTSKTLTSLQKKKTYYIKVRVYKIDSSNKKIYGSYSTVKYVKTK